MSDDDVSHPYLTLAAELLAGNISEEDLPAEAALLPRLHQKHLNQLAQQAEGFASSEPRRGWAIAQVARDAAFSQDCDPFVRSVADWYLGRACNHWTQPRRVEAAISAARHGFEALNLSGWIVACDWQLNALSWTRPSFIEAAQALQNALKGLEQPGFTDFIPDCRLSLAYAQILIGDHNSALENILLSEEIYLDRGDILNQARCWQTRAGSLRRQGHFHAAHQELKQALLVYEQQNAIPDQARAHYHMALGHLLQVEDLTEAVNKFEKAAELFDSVDLELWRAMCINNLGSVYLFTGELTLSDQYYREAQDTFIHHDVRGLLADNLNDHGEVNILRGKPHLSTEQFKRCIQINEELGAQLSAAVGMTNLGKAYGQSGRYQDALFHLERAIEALKPFKIYFRLATCERYVASIWSRLGRPELAHHYLDQAAAHYEMTDQKALLASVHNYRAATFFQQGLEKEALKSLELALDVALLHGLRPQSALAKRLLGEAFLRVNDRSRAVTYLTEARAEFVEMGMTAEYAACMISQGVHHELNSDVEKAKSAFEEALHLSEGAFPEIDWRASIELGNLTEKHGDIQLAIRHYRAGMAALTTIRRNFLQPALAGSYLQTPAQAFDKVVSVSARAGAAGDTVHFLEEAKASTLLRQLAIVSTRQRDPEAQELADLKAEIDLLKTRLKVSLDETPVLQSAFQARQMRSQLRKLTEQYDQLKARLERISLSESSTAGFSTSFDLEFFQKRASSFLGEKWAALDYYISERELVTVLVTLSDCKVYSQPVSNRFVMALESCDRARQVGGPLLESDLQVLGKILIPELLAEVLSPDTYLLISPHRRLHQVPWPALTVEFANQPLVSVCIPSVTPSLHGLVLLWERDVPTAGPERADGLLIGLSTFNSLHDELPLARDEVTALRSKLGSGGHVLAENDATWKNLLKLWDTEDDEPPRFAWLHIASHFIPDRHTGRLSAIAFHDGDIWLDQLRDVSPLPPLLSLSACNSNDSFLYEGEERMDLQTTCFIAGANTIVGSAWPILDHAASELIPLFYTYYLSGLSPARAAAETQRQFIRDGKELINWASFICAGTP